MVSVWTLLTPSHPTLDTMLPSVTCRVFQLSLESLYFLQWMSNFLLECCFLKDCECKIHFYIFSLTKHMTRWVCHTLSWMNRWEWDWASLRDYLTQISRSLKALITYYTSSAVLGGGQAAADSTVEGRAIEGCMHMFCGGLGPRAVRILDSLFFLDYGERTS